MAIKRFNPKTDEIKVGQFVCFEPLLTEYVATRPHRVHKIAGQRVYYRDWRDEYDEGFKLSKSVLFVCETAEEGMVLSDLNNARFKAKIAADKAFAAEWKSKVDEIIANS